ncbi:MAG: toxin-antitoxin system YwqK family antitoxin [Bacteroidales bacterium]|nr:toxin-antitoxin system YwqK family antitoxin [Bacteroidales bacterium]
MRLLIIMLFSALSCATAIAQSDTVFNQTDARNLKQGHWKKYYPNGNLMYKGYFTDNKPVGEMRRYFESGALRAVLYYHAGSEYSSARLYYENGNLAATGNYFHTQKDSTWVYYSFYEKVKTAEETFQQGKRHGMMINYYSNGEPSERLEWHENMKSGIWEQYFPGNILRLKAAYVNNKLEGKFMVYYADGKPYIEGDYLNDRRNGTWTFYNADGSLQKTLHYTNGIAAEENELNKEQQDFFRMIDENQGKYEEPDETNFLTPQNRP